MKKVLQLSFYRLRKDKKQFLLLGVILLLTTIITNLSFTLFMNVGNVYDEMFKEMNTANIHVAIAKQQDNEVYVSDIKNMDFTKEVETREGLLSMAVAEDFQDTDFEMQTIFYDIDDNHKMNKLEITEGSEKKNQDGIYLPLYMSELGEFSVGDHISYRINDASYTWKVNGKVQEMQYGNYGAGTIGVFLSENEYEKLSEDNQCSLVQVYSIQTNQGADSEKVTKEITDYFSEHDISVLQVNYDSANKQVRTLFTNILVMVLFAFALIVLFVSLSLSKFKISNTIEMETANMGALKALGYTSNSIILTLVIPYVLVCGITLLIGIVLSNLLLPLAASLIGFQAGMSLEIGINWLSMIITFVSIELMTILFTYFGAAKIKKLQPVTAIREGSTGNGKRRNVLIILVLFFMTLLMSFAGTLFYNIVIETNNFTSTLSEEMPSVIIHTNETTAESIKNDILSMDEVKDVMFYSIEKVEVEDTTIQAFVSEDFSKVSNDLCYEGRSPENENEIAIGNSLVESGGYKIGDMIQVKQEDQTKEYKIVGFIQSVNYQGNVCELTNTGYARLSNDTNFTSQYIYVKDGVNTEKLVDKIEVQHKGELTKVINYEKLTQTTNDMYITAIKAVMIVIVLIIMLIIWLVLFMVIRSLIIQQRKELGIYKAIGYTNKQLRLKLASSFLPVAIPTIVITALLGLFYMEIICNVLFQSLGAMKNNLEISFVVLLIAALIIVVQTFIISFLLTVPIKKISVCELIKE
ncbi:ABC transporter permease [Breznakia pachnodae]|uniref:ABC transport system permease protein n=1 Tax=Breznakia pachnodae TaxID=265178 RepID=A0ABU0E573_9FIRM|nr:ABC transporter permease [Breznakia pachnodae]MDQ0362052.1 putative ABC transport system permease protein [Breznakia pachnodae]